MNVGVKKVVKISLNVITLSGGVSAPFAAVKQSLITCSDRICVETKNVI